MKKGVKERGEDWNTGNIFNVTSYSITEIWNNLSSVFFCFCFCWLVGLLVFIVCLFCFLWVLFVCL